VRIAVPDYIGVRDPSFTSGVGIIQYANKYLRIGKQSFTKKSGNKKIASATSESSKPSLMERFKNWLSEFI
jgi:cell division protein FtsA